MTSLKSYFTFLIFFIFIANNTALSQISPKDVDRLVENALNKFGVAGTAVGIVKDGKVVMAKGYGLWNVKEKKKADQHTLFGIGSNSKAFTTAALAILVEEGKLSWKDRVIDYIPDFRMYNSYVTENFLIEDLLTHRSGLGLGVGDLMIFPDSSDFTIHDIASGFQYFHPVSPFRTKFDYDNLLYLIAGEVIHKVSGMTWEEFVTKHIFEPLGMNDTRPTYSWTIGMTDVAVPYSDISGELTAIPPFGDMVNGAAGGIMSSARDMCEWMLVQLNHGKYGDSLENTLFTEMSQQKMWTIHTVMKTDGNPRYNSHFSGYGLGWMLKDVKGNMVVSHTGGMPGMLSKVTLIPDLNFGLVVLTNTSEGGAFVFEAISRTVVDSYLGLDEIDWVEKMGEYAGHYKERSDTVTTKVWETINTNSTQEININNYLGVYEDKWFGKTEVFLKNGQLWFKSYRSPKMNGAMYYYKANTFAIKWEYKDMNADAFAIFCLDEDGKAQSIKMKGISPNIDFSFDFQDLDLKRVSNE